MRNWIGRLAFTYMALTLGLVTADCNHSTRSGNNYMFPVGRLVLNPETSNEYFATSLILEAGVRNYRVNGTIGTWVTERSRFKVSGEYLAQKLGWNFSPGRSHDWVQQGAVGGDYQYLLSGCSMLKAVDVKGYYSYAPSKEKGIRTCVTPGGPAFSFLRHIAGSNAYGGSIGGDLLLSEKSRLSLSVDYDYVNYRRIYSHDKKVAGFGGTFAWITRLPCCVDFSLEGQFRKPFNYFGARLAWPQVCGSANTRLAFFGGWTRGKFHLPNAVQAGVELVYNFQTGCRKVEKECCPALFDPCDLNAWALIPAVMMPEVLAIAEQIALCPPPSSGPIPSETFVEVIEFTYDAAALGNFDANGAGPLVFSATGLPPGASIDPVTGLISGVNTVPDSYNGTYPISVTATDACGSTTQNFTLVFITLE